MIPLTYRLRDRVRVEPAGSRWRAVSEVPLSVVAVNAGAARLLLLTEGGATVGALAAALGTDVERVLRLCEYFRRRGLLEVRGAAAGVARRHQAADLPTVSVIIPVKDRSDELAACLAALGELDYPRDRYDVIVIDDGSTDDGPAEAAARFGCRVLRNGVNRGPGFSRNAGATVATGEVLAFIDSDCVARPEWLRELTPYLGWPKVAAVGGRVEGFADTSRLDRYEQVASPLDMGRHVLLAADDGSTFYVPTCNLLVRRSAYLAVGGIRDELRVGEDVDLCWRLRARGEYLVYVPEGSVRHRHRRSWWGALRQRAQYGTSEATLHALHPEKRKSFSLPTPALASLVSLGAVIVAGEPRLAPLILVPLAIDWLVRSARLRREGLRVHPGSVAASVVRGHLSFAFVVSFHVVRYYLVVLLVLGVVLPGVWAVAALAGIGVGTVEFVTRRPRLNLPVYLAFFAAEHVAYQVGVAAGCVRRRTFRSYLPALRRARGAGNAVV